MFLLAMPCGMWNPGSLSGMESVPPALEVQGLNQWTTCFPPEILIRAFSAVLL